jgi:hypothetical protein
VNSGAITGTGTTEATAQASGACICPGGQTVSTSSSTAVSNPGEVTTSTTTSTVLVPYQNCGGISLTGVKVGPNGTKVTLEVQVPCAGDLTAKATHTSDPSFVFAKTAFAGPNKTITVATGKATATESGPVTVVLNSTKIAEQLWTHHERLRVRVSVYFLPSTGGHGTSLTGVFRY